jgi:biuret amidohydrolase
MPGVAIQRQVSRARLTEQLKKYLEIKAATSAIVTIDMHRGHLDPEVATEPVPAEQAARIVESCAFFLTEMRKRHIPIIHVVLKYRSHPEPAFERAANPFKRAVDRAKQELLGLPSTLRDHNVEGNVQIQVMPTLYMASDLIVDSKKRLSAFYGTDLEILLRCLKRDTLLLCGVNTNTCVQCTAFEAANRDFTTIVMSDCCASLYDDELHKFALDNISRCFGWVLSSTEVISKIDKGGSEI